MTGRQKHNKITDHQVHRNLLLSDAQWNTLYHSLEYHNEMLAHHDSINYKHSR